MPSIKDIFKKFVFSYIAAGHTQTDESEAELKRLIDEWSQYYNIMQFLYNNCSNKSLDVQPGWWGWALVQLIQSFHLFN